VEFSYLDNLKGMKLIYTLFFLLSTYIVSAQSDTIYPAKKVYHVGDTLKMVFKAKNCTMRLSSNGACSAKLLSINQFKKPTGWAQIFQPPQMDCGLPYVDIANNTVTFYPQNYAGTFRMVFFSDKGIIETDEYRVE
jgi:hypothetical protein